MEKPEPKQVPSRTICLSTLLKTRQADTKLCSHTEGDILETASQLWAPPGKNVSLVPYLPVSFTLRVFC